LKFFWSYVSHALQASLISRSGGDDMHVPFTDFYIAKLTTKLGKFCMAGGIGGISDGTLFTMRNQDFSLSLHGCHLGCLKAAYEEERKIFITQ
jgi:hypothetical protein